MIEDGLGGSKYAGRIIEMKMGSALVEFEVSRFFHESPLFCMLSSSPLAQPTVATGVQRRGFGGAPSRVAQVGEYPASPTSDPRRLPKGMASALNHACVCCMQSAYRSGAPSLYVLQRLAKGDEVEVLYDDGWWIMTFMGTRPSASAVEYNVYSALYQVERWVPADSIRPNWKRWGSKWKQLEQTSDVAEQPPPSSSVANPPLGWQSPTPYNELGEGWTRVSKPRPAPSTAVDHLYISPDGVRYRSIKQAVAAATGRPQEDPPAASTVAGVDATGEQVYPRVILRLRTPPDARHGSGSAKKRKPEAAPPTIWDCGSSWMPKTHDWGTRHPDAHGCGKCRWRPSGCRGCIAAATTFVPPVPPVLAPGEVALPSEKQHRHCYAHQSDGPNEAERLRSVRELQDRSLRIASGPVQSDASGFGVVARRPLAAGEQLIDLSVFYVARPADYALAHLPQFHALELGNAAYFQLAEPALAHLSLTYLVNEARHACGGDRDGPPPNVAYKAVRPRSGGIALALQVLTPIAEGHELLANYDQRLKMA